MPDQPATDPVVESATRVFAEYRELLFAIAYNMLGSVADTEDVLQETWVVWTARNRTREADPVTNVRGYLVRVAVNEALARRAHVDRRRETYIGPWLPEPLVDDGTEAVEQTEALSMAVLVVLETLSPLERAVFVLHEVFGYPHTEIADLLDRTPSAVRQLAHRAREHVQARRPRQHVDRRVQQQATERFVAAAAGGDLAELMQLLAPDVTLWTDGGGKVRRASLHPIHGADRVARFLIGVAQQPREVVVRYRFVNGDPSALLFAGESPLAALVLDLTDDGTRVEGVYAVGNPDKLTRID